MILDVIQKELLSRFYCLNGIPIKYKEKGAKESHGKHKKVSIKNHLNTNYLNYYMVYTKKVP
jgi:hypothetical protein